VSVSATGASVTRSGGNWIIKPGESAKEVKVTVSANMDGRQQQMGSNTYRVKSLPTPSAFFVVGGEAKLEGAVAKKAASASDAIVEASYGPDGILDINFKVVGFSMRVGSKIEESHSGNLTAAQRDLIKGMRSGESFIINSVRAVGPDGKEKRLNTIAMTIK
jgi:hypothetical protein